MYTVGLILGFPQGVEQHMDSWLWSLSLYLSLSLSLSFSLPLPLQVNTVRWTPVLDAASPGCVRTGESVWTFWWGGSYASVRLGNTRSPTARWPPAASPDCPSSPSEDWGRGSTSQCLSCEFHVPTLWLYPHCVSLCLLPNCKSVYIWICAPCTSYPRKAL